MVHYSTGKSYDETMAKLMSRREEFRGQVEYALNALPPTHLARPLLSNTYRALDRRPPTKREKALVEAILMSDSKPAAKIYMGFSIGPPPQATEWKTKCLRCGNLASKIFTIVAGFPSCDTCFVQFDEKFQSLRSCSLDIEFGETPHLERSRDPLGIADEEMDIELE